MSTPNAQDTRNAIVNAIAKRSQTKFAKLFYEMDANPTQQQIILVLQELNEQKDFYVDFNISLKYFLDLYEHLAASNKNFLFNEAGLLVHSATKIYDRRLDCVFQRIEEQMLALSTATNTNATETPKEDTPTETAEKPTKKRKRLVELALDPFEFQWTRRKFKKLGDDKRFGVGAKIDRSKLFAQKLHVENYLHPALWKYSEIIDLENEEEVDSKRNYKLFTSYVEHRYNTLVPDINFRLYYKMKDFLDAEDERDNEEQANSIWPPLSQAFVKQYLRIEDRALAHVSAVAAKRRCLESVKTAADTSVELTLNGDLDVGGQGHIDSDEPMASNDENQLATGTIDGVENAGEQIAVLNENEMLQGKPTSASNADGMLSESGLGSSISDSAILGESGLNITEATVHNSEDAVENDKLNEKPASATNENVSVNGSLANEGMLFESGLGSSIRELGLSDTVTDLNATQPLDGIVNATLNESLTNEVASSTVALNSTQLEAANVSKQIIETPKHANSETVALTVHIETDNGVLNDKINYHDQRSPQKNDDEGVCLSDIDEGPLTPITIHVEKSVLNGAMDVEVAKETTQTTNAAAAVQVDLNNLEEFRLAPHQTPIEFWPIKLNILEFSPQVIKKMRRPKLLTDLGEEMELFLKARLYKRTRGANEYPTARQFKLLERSVSSASNAYNTPPPSPCDFEMVLLGFDEAGKPSMRPLSDTDEIAKSNNEATLQPMKIGEHHQRLSRDSGVGNDLLTATPDRSSSLLHSISEETERTQETKKDGVCKNLFNVEILGNVLLQAASESTENAQENTTKVVEDVQIATEKPLENANVAAAQLTGEEIAAKNNDSMSQEKTSTIETAATVANIENTLNEANESFMDGANFDHSEPFDLDTALNKDDKHVELCDDTVAKIQTWHRTLQPILAKSRERHHFDVFQIGTSILSEFNNKTQANDSVTLEDVMQQQDPSYVSRYFLSALLLANQGNIDLKVHNKHEDKPSLWSDVSFKLLSNTRHVVSVEDNIGMLPTTPQKATVTTPTAKNTKSPKKSALLPPPPPPPTVPPVPAQSTSSRKRKLSNAEAVTIAALPTDAVKVVGTIKPIGKVVRLSSSDDSGIASLESDFELVS